MKARKKERLEGREGSTYQTGIGVTEEGKERTKGIIDGLLKSVSKEELKEISSIVVEESDTKRENPWIKWYFYMFLFWLRDYRFETR